MLSPSPTQIRDARSRSWSNCCAWCNANPTQLCDYHQHYERSTPNAVVIHHTQIKYCPHCERYTRLTWTTTS